MRKPANNSRNVYEEILRDIEGEVSVEKINTDLNTMMNSKPSGKEKKMIKMMRKITTLKHSCQNGIQT